MTESMQFNEFDDYWPILQWMKDCGDTCALAGEILYTTPIMLIKTPVGTDAVRPGEYVVRDTKGGFHASVCPYWPPCSRCQPRTVGTRVHVRPETASL